MTRHAAPLLAATALLFAGCGGGGETVTPEPAAPQPTTQPTQPTSQPPAGQDAPTQLTVTLDPGTGPLRTMTLSCDPPGGDHPDPDAACAAIQDAGVEAFEPVPGDVACTEIYGGPQTARVTGVVNGTPVSAVFNRTNGCEIARWDALVPLLGTAGGVDA